MTEKRSDLPVLGFADQRSFERWLAATILDRSGYVLKQIGAILARTRKGTTAICAQWHRFDLKRAMATVVERSLRETLDGEPAPAAISEPSAAILNAA